jgi:hypothetical protein
VSAYETTLIQADFIAATAIKASNAAIFTLESAAFLLASLQVVPDAARTVK